MEPVAISGPMMLFLICMTGFAGVVDSAAGGGGLISLPAYLFAGLPAHYTYGTNKFSAACGTTFATARVMVSHVTYEIAADLAEQMEQIEGVSSAVFGSSDVGADTEEDSEPVTPEDIAEYFKGADALISVTFDGEEEDEISLAALSAIRELLAPYDYYIDSAVGNSQADSLASEMGIILAVAAVMYPTSRTEGAAHVDYQPLFLVVSLIMVAAVVVLFLTVREPKLAEENRRLEAAHPEWPRTTVPATRPCPPR